MIEGVDLKINLGCGEHVLPPPWINVDTAVRGEKPPDIDADLKNLHMFRDGCAAIVIAIHVIEHFYRWEVEDLLQEWKRLLSPGGILVMELPNLELVCRNYLGGAPAPIAISAMYGDPAHKDVRMCHKWGYTPRSLKKILEGQGFVHVRDEPAKLHFKEVRDMRIIAERGHHDEHS